MTQPRSFAEVGKGPGRPHAVEAQAPYFWWLPWLGFVLWALWIAGCAHMPRQEAVQMGLDALLLVPWP